MTPASGGGRIVVVGGYGLIGSHVVSRLLTEGYAVAGVGRDVAAARRRFAAVDWRQLDLRCATVEAWASLLEGANAVVNCAGALQDGLRDDLDAVHVQAVRALTRACGHAGVRRLVHVSAAGVTAGAGAFGASKLAAEEVLKATDLDWVILRPGLVVAPNAYGGGALLRGLAGFPLVIPLAYGASQIQVVSAFDVADAVVHSLAPGARTCLAIDLVHGESASLAAIVMTLRGWLGLAPAPVLPVPATAARCLARICDALGWFGWRSPMRSAALEQLRRGVRGDAGAAERELGLRLRSLREMLAAWPAGAQERRFAQTYFLKPAILTTLAAFWLLSGAIGLARYDTAAAILAASGLAPPLARSAVAAGSIVDVVLAAAVCFRATAAMALRGMIVVAAAYLVGGTILAPELWLDPLGALLKIPPVMLLAAVGLAVMDDR